MQLLGKELSFMFSRGKVCLKQTNIASNNYNGNLAIADDENTLQSIRPVKQEFPEDCCDNYFSIGLTQGDGYLKWINGQQPSEFIKSRRT